MRKLSRWITHHRIITVLLFIGALLPRVLQPGRFITWDELKWVFRSIGFLDALSRGDLAATFQAGHPGVTTMWCGVMGVGLRCLIEGEPVRQALATVASLGSLNPFDAQAMKTLAPFLVYGRLVVSTVTALCVAGMYVMARHFLKGWVAFLGVALVALDPFCLAHSRVLHVDALAASFMTLSVLGMLAHLANCRSRRYLVVSGCSAGMALLSKSPAIFLLPMLVLAFIVAALVSRRVRARGGKTLLMDLAIWGTCVVVLFLLFFPAMWVSPLETLMGIGGTGSHHALTPHETIFYRGTIGEDPGPLFYPQAVAFRLTPLIVVGLLLSIPMLFVRKPRQAERRSLFTLFLFVVFFIAFMTFGAKKFDRYLLPIFPVLDLIAAVGYGGLLLLIVRLLERILGTGRKGWKAWWRWLPVALGVAAVLTVAGRTSLPYAPHFLSYYNPLLGGGEAAAEEMPVGWGEGVDLAADYLNGVGDAPELKVATWAVAGLAPLFDGQVLPLSEDNVPIADYILLYLGDVQADGPFIQELTKQKPSYVARLHGIDYAWVYPNLHYVELVDHIEANAGSQDVIIVNAASAFTKHYSGALPVHIVEGDTEAQVAEKLAQLTQGAEYIWYLEYDDASPTSTGWLKRQLDVHCFKLDRRPFAYGKLVRYAVPPGVSFSVVGIRKPADVDFERVLQLSGYGLSRAVLEYRKKLGIALQWDVMGAMEHDYHIFIHLVDENGVIWGQWDQRLLDGAGRPTSQWEEGQRVVVRYVFSARAGTPAGRYRVKVGVYQWDNLERLRIMDDEDVPVGAEYTLSPVYVVTPTYPPQLADLSIQHLVQYDFGGQIRLLGANVGEGSVRSGATLHFELFWQTLAPTETDYQLLIQLRDEDGHVLGAERVPPSRASYPTSSWQVGEITRYPQQITISPEAVGGDYVLTVNLIDPSTGQRLALEDAHLAVVTVKARERLFDVPVIAYPVPASFGGDIELLGYDLQEESVAPKGVLHLTLYWKTLGPTDIPYTVFTHLLDGEGKVRGQRDSVPVDGTRPTTGWAVGEIIVDRYEISVDGDTPEGTCQIEIGLYNPESGDRMPAFDAEGQRLEYDRVLLPHAIQVIPGA